jgi:hypothetical protein
MKPFFSLFAILIVVATLFTSCQTPEEKSEKEDAKHQKEFLNNPPPPMSKPQ